MQDLVLTSEQDEYLREVLARENWDGSARDRFEFLKDRDDGINDLGISFEMFERVVREIRSGERCGFCGVVGGVGDYDCCGGDMGD